MTEDKELCKKCGGKCCLRPLFTLDEYIRMVMAIGNDTAQAAGPTPINGGWLFTKAERCPGLTPIGCILDYASRPMACRIYPFVAVPVIRDTKVEYELLLAVQTCPHWDVFGGGVEDAKKEIDNNVR